MDYASVIVPAAPVRKKARHQSEMISQLLFGESVQVIKKKKSTWVKVRAIHDEYEGWVTISQLVETSKDSAMEYCPAVTSTSQTSISIADQKMVLPVGASLPALHGEDGLVGDIRYSVSGEYILRNQQPPSEDLVNSLTEEWLNAPYLWGGRTIFGVDCSGFVQVNFKRMGIDLPRDAWQQAQVGETIAKLRDARTGDLAFFDDRDEIVHVGILLGNDRIIHASGKVRIDRMDKKGIINAETGMRSHSLRVIKRCWNPGLIAESPESEREK